METAAPPKNNEFSITNHVTVPQINLAFSIDLNGNIKSWNKAAEKVSGYANKEIIGKPLAIFYKKEETKSASEAMERAVQQGFSENIGWRVKKSGELFWASESITRLGENGSTDGFLVIIRELKKTKEIEDVAHRWQYMFEHSEWPFAITRLDANVFELVNPSFARMYGYSADELTGKPITLVMHPDAQAKLVENTGTLVRKGHYMYESKHVRKDGTPLPVAIDAIAVRDDAGKVQQVLVSVRDLTELKEMQQASLQNSEKFEQLFELASDGIFIADINGRYTNVNTAGCKMLGYAKEELIGKTIMDVLREEDLPRLQEQKEFLLKPGQSRVNEWFLKRKDGSLVPTEISAQILPNGQWQAFVRDISERKKTQEILIRSEQKFRGLLEQYQDAIIIVDKHGLVEFVNNQFKSKFGYEPSEVIGKPVEQLMPERFRMKHVGNRMKYMAHPIPRPMGLGLELYALRKDGSEFPVDISLVPFETDRGMVFTAFIRDLSDRKRYEAQQKFLAEISVILSQNTEFEDKLHKFASLCIPFLADFCMIFISEKDKLIPKACVHSEKSFQKNLEAIGAYLFSKPEISPYQPGTITETLKPLHIENVTEHFLQSICPGEEAYRKFAELDPKTILFVPLVAREKIIGVLVLAMSLSGRKFSEDDVLFIQLVGYRIGLSIDNINLYREAKQAVREREDILSIVSHDLRNPLSAIKSGFQSINEFARAGNYGMLPELLPVLTEASNFMERLINDLLDFSKIQQGALPLKLEEVRVKKLIETVLQSVKAKAGEKSIEFAVNLPEQDGVMICDPHRIKQVLNNLVGNAIKFTPEKGRIVVTVKDQAEKFFFSVLDSGPGIPEANLHHIFERYWQEQKTAHLGTGLGLFIAKGIVDAHKGRIWAESKTGQGANFQFEIPKTLTIEQ